MTDYPPRNLRGAVAARWCWLRRCQLFVGIVGRRWGDGCRIGPRTAWQVACIVENRPYRRGECL